MKGLQQPRLGWPRFQVEQSSGKSGLGLTTEALDSPGLVVKRKGMCLFESRKGVPSFSMAERGALCSYD